MDPSPYYSIINVHLVDINVFVKSDESPSLPVQVIKEKLKCCGLRITKGNNFKRIRKWPLTVIFLLEIFILWISMCLPNFMKFRHCFFKILKNQNFTDGQTDRRTV